jgi:hypothetical protein
MLRLGHSYALSKNVSRVRRATPLLVVFRTKRNQNNGNIHLQASIGDFSTAASTILPDRQNDDTPHVARLSRKREFVRRRPDPVVALPTTMPVTVRPGSLPCRALWLEFGPSCRYPSNLPAGSLLAYFRRRKVYLL